MKNEKRSRLSAGSTLKFSENVGKSLENVQNVATEKADSAVEKESQADTDSDSSFSENTSFLIARQNISLSDTEEKSQIISQPQIKAEWTPKFKR